MEQSNRSKCSHGKVGERSELYKKIIFVCFISSILLGQNQFDKLVDLNNAILISERCQIRKGYEEYWYRDVYLKKLYSGTAALLESDAALLAAMDVMDAEYPDLYEGYHRRAAMTNLWIIEKIMVDYLSTHYSNGEEAHQLSISNFVYDGRGDLKFDFKRYFPFYRDYVTNNINGHFFVSGSFLEDKLQLLYLKNY